MKIAIVLNTSWNIYNFRLGLVKALLQNNHEVHCIAPFDNYSAKLENEGCIFHKVSMDSRGVNPVKDILLFFELRKIYKKVKPDVALHYTVKPNIYGTIAAKTLGIPSINNVCGLGSSFIRGGFVASIVQKLYRLSFLFASKIFFQNPDDQFLFISKRILSGKKTALLPGSGINLQAFRPEISDNDDKFTFLMISRVIRDKGVYEFVEAAKSIKKSYPNAHFKILGALDHHHIHGIPKDEFETWINNNIIEYLGTTDDVKPFISKANCIVLPSYREGTPRTLLEAASMAKPIITTDTPGCRQIVQNDYNGWLCKPANALDLTLQMEKSLTVPKEKIAKMGQNSRKKMEEEYDEAFVIEKYLNEIKHLS